MGDAGLALALVLSWGAGIAVLAPLLWTGRLARWQTLAGYGFAAGIVLTTLVMRAVFAAKLGLSFASTAGGLALIAAGGIAAMVFLRKRGLVAVPLTLPAERESGWRRVAWFALIAMILIRVAGLALEAWWRPLFPWDAWDIWGPKTKIWFETRDLNNFYGHFDNGYPPAINLIQIWANLGLGAWDDAKMSLAWPLLLGALALAAYGQARTIGASPLAAAVVSYLLASIPMLDVHAALPGYADLPLAVCFGLAAMAFFVWVVSEDWRELVLALLFVAIPPLFKIPGVIWSLTLVPAILMALFDRYSGRKAMRWAVALVVAGLLAGGYVYAKQRNFAMTLYQAHFAPNPTSGFVLDNYLLLDNYHLLWYLLAVSLLLWWRGAIAKALRPATALIAAGVGFLAVSFLFTNSVEWWGDYGTLNRATLHFVPALVFYLFLISRTSISLSTTTASSFAGPAASAAGPMPGS